MITAGHAQLRPFYDVFHTHMRDLGSPAHSITFYRLIERHLGERIRFIVAREGDDLIGGALLCKITGTAMNLHTVALRAYNRRCPNYFIYWHMIEQSCSEDCTAFDMGRTLEGGNNLRFKQNWNPSTIPLIYNYYLRRVKEPPFPDPRNPRYRLPIAVWKRLPVALTKKVGPHIITGLV